MYQGKKTVNKDEQYKKQEELTCFYGNKQVDYLCTNHLFPFHTLAEKVLLHIIPLCYFVLVIFTANMDQIILNIEKYNLLYNAYINLK